MFKNQSHIKVIGLNCGGGKCWCGLEDFCFHFRFTLLHAEFPISLSTIHLHRADIYYFKMYFINMDHHKGQFQEV